MKNVKGNWQEDYTQDGKKSKNVTFLVVVPSLFLLQETTIKVGLKEIRTAMAICP